MKASLFVLFTLNKSTLRQVKYYLCMLLVVDFPFEVKHLNSMVKIWKLLVSSWLLRISFSQTTLFCGKIVSGKFWLWGQNSGQRSLELERSMRRNALMLGGMRGFTYVCLHWELAFFFLFYLHIVFHDYIFICFCERNTTIFRLFECIGFG